LATQVVRPLFDHKFAHLSSALFHLQGEEKMETKLLISIENVRLLSCQITDSVDNKVGHLGLTFGVSSTYRLSA
jgi:hypothetical protein